MTVEINRKNIIRVSKMAAKTNFTEIKISGKPVPCIFFKKNATIWISYLGFKTYEGHLEFTVKIIPEYMCILCLKGWKNRISVKNS